MGREARTGFRSFFPLLCSVGRRSSASAAALPADAEQVPGQGLPVFVPAGSQEPLDCSKAAPVTGTNEQILGWLTDSKDC